MSKVVKIIERIPLFRKQKDGTFVSAGTGPAVCFYRQIDEDEISPSDEIIDHTECIGSKRNAENELTDDRPVKKLKTTIQNYPDEDQNDDDYTDKELRTTSKKGRYERIEGTKTLSRSELLSKSYKFENNGSCQRVNLYQYNSGLYISMPDYHTVIRKKIDIKTITQYYSPDEITKNDLVIRCVLHATANKPRSLIKIDASMKWIDPKDKFTISIIEDVLSIMKDNEQKTNSGPEPFTDSNIELASICGNGSSTKLPDLPQNPIPGHSHSGRLIDSSK